MLEENRQNLAGTDRGSYYNQEEWLQEFLNDKVAMVAKVVIVKMMIRIILKIQKQLFADVLQNRY